MRKGESNPYKRFFSLKKKNEQNQIACNLLYHYQHILPNDVRNQDNHNMYNDCKHQDSNFNLANAVLTNNK